MLEDHFESSHTFTASQGLNMAFTVVNPFSRHLIEPLDPSYGRIRFRKFQWGLDRKGAFYLQETELKSHACSREELGMSGSDPKFWPTEERQENLINILFPVLRCIDQSE